MEAVSYETDDVAGDEATSESELESPVVFSPEQFHNIDLAYQDHVELPSHYTVVAAGKRRGYHPRLVLTLSAHHNRLLRLPVALGVFSKLVELDLSYNALDHLPDGIGRLERLRSLNLKNNRLGDASFPKSFGRLRQLESLQLSGNELSELPETIFSLPKLRFLYLGANRITHLPEQLRGLRSLEHLYLGGNALRSVPRWIGSLRRLSSLHLADNRLETIPSSVAQLQSLEALSLHNNQLKALPVEIVKLSNLGQLSLRNNPLVYRFAKEVRMEPPSLLELAGRVVKVKKFDYRAYVPKTVADYLSAAHECVNPKCKGVYFDARVEHVKFVDFCGKYRVPLLQYLCSPVCTDEPAWAVTTDDSESEQAGPSGLGASSPEDGGVSAEEEAKLKKVLLG